MYCLDPSKIFFSFSQFYLENENYVLYFGQQTALMQACQHGHWEVVQTLILFRANVGSLTLMPSFPNSSNNYLWNLLNKNNKNSWSLFVRFTGQII